MKNSLLEQLLIKAGMIYLSDLHVEKNHELVYGAVLSIKAEEFSMKEWEKAIEYILESGKKTFQNQEEAKLFLCKRLSAIK